MAQLVYTQNICTTFAQWWTNVEDVVGRRCTNATQMPCVCRVATQIYPLSIDMTNKIIHEKMFNLCYGSTIIINIFTLTVQGSTLDVRFCKGHQY